MTDNTTKTTISIEDVRYVAGLAKIAVTDDEAEKLRGELDAIIGYVGQLDSLDTTGIEPTYQVTGLTNVDREDAIIDYGVDQQALLSNAPDSQDNQIKVPKVL
ncbi:MAG TPA: Asp-tRNA(Asn)/Glu-tRNA(Gln) amidotransferase subunit GatC [Candidatus Saccharimonadales bacterium]|nr:Asp-tRNA(Asn)/Glu-tRNA(Gln) amidotransferase subunit GatC [Candidatus Saccharimonadales bacterium]